MHSFTLNARRRKMAAVVIFCDFYCFFFGVVNEVKGRWKGSR